MNHRYDINCDLGEGESREQTRALMACVDSANIACGGHAGNESTLRACLLLARELGVRPGAHPGLPHRAGFGRERLRDLTPAQLTDLLDQQVGHAAALGRDLGVQLTHVKLHGSLYHLVDDNPGLGETYLAHVARTWPGLAIVARVNGGVARRARTESNRVWKEAFLDRGYRANGTLVPRGEPHALLTDVDSVLARVQHLTERGGWPAVDGTWIPLDPDTLCIHGDSPGALSMLTQLRQVHPRPRPPSPGSPGTG